ncbi:MAG TPA: AMP phosphorylase [Candidatus Nanoarchaeia archaeon]|nr:AMP phosphorylase [Candidatus Nanoarchaeia archaeon]
MKLIIKDMDIATGITLVAIMNRKDAALLDLHLADRIMIRKGSREIVAVVDFAETAKTIPQGTLGLFEEVLANLHAKSGDEVSIHPVQKPESLLYIKKKMDGGILSYHEIKSIIDDVVNNKITTVELTYYVAANYMKGMDFKEVVHLTRAMINSGNKLEFGNRIVVDKHCIGGVCGNRTTPIIVPILAVAGLTVPKTSSRSITSPAGTADTLEVLCNVVLEMKDIVRVVDKTGACLVWGGAVHLAPADDSIINVEHPLSIDAEGQLLASIMAKKGSVSATHVIIDIPVGYGTKVTSQKRAKHLAKEFSKLGKELGMVIDVVITDGSEPIGNGIGPALEAIDILRVLKNDPKAPKDLRNKSLAMASVLLESTGKAKKGHGWHMAEALLDSGLAFKKFIEILTEQGIRASDEKEIALGEYHFNVRANKTGFIKMMNNRALSRIARIAGCPEDKKAGIFLFKHNGDKVINGERVFTVYSESSIKLRYAKEMVEKVSGFVIR